MRFTLNLLGLSISFDPTDIEEVELIYYSLNSILVFGEHMTSESSRFFPPLSEGSEGDFYSSIICIIIFGELLSLYVLNSSITLSIVFIFNENYLPTVSKNFFSLSF